MVAVVTPRSNRARLNSWRRRFSPSASPAVIPVAKLLSWLVAGCCARTGGTEATESARSASRVNEDEAIKGCVLTVGAACANRVVALAQRAEEVRQRLQRPDDALAQERRHDEPCGDDENAERPFGAAAEVAGEEQRQADDDRGKSAQ